MAALAFVVIRAMLAARSGVLPINGAVEVLEGVSMGLAGVALFHTAFRVVGWRRVTPASVGRAQGCGA